MGLDTTHDCWHGAYSSFGEWRREVAAVVGIPLRLMEGFFYLSEKDRERIVSTMPSDAGFAGAYHFLNAIKALQDLPLSWEMFKDEPLVPLLRHSDCDGSIEWAICLPMAVRLEEIISQNKLSEWARVKTEQFAKGLRLAHDSHENVKFH